MYDPWKKRTHGLLGSVGMESRANTSHCPELHKLSLQMRAAVKLLGLPREAISVSCRPHTFLSCVKLARDPQIVWHVVILSFEWIPGAR